VVTWRGQPLPRRTVLLALIASVAVSVLAWVLIVPWRAPGNDAGYAPVQPIAFSHPLHVRELEIGCLYCHSTATTARFAGMPAANVCMNCHRFVAAPSQAVKDEQWQAAREGREVRRVVSEAMRELYRSQGLDERLEPKPGAIPTAIAWARVTQFPDFAYFDHRAHARVGVECRQCHGEVQTFERTRQDSSLSMGFCVDCHKRSNRDGVNGVAVQASTDCVGCHR
jgi:hypothetical protein